MDILGKISVFANGFSGFFLLLFSPLIFAKIEKLAILRELKRIRV
jgi:hypothetical protein